MSKMTQEAKEKLKAMPTARCFKCGSPRTYRNPLVKCDECKKKFCFDHIFGLQVKDGMAENEEVRDICKNCKEKYNYHKL